MLCIWVNYWTGLQNEECAWSWIYYMTQFNNKSCNLSVELHSLQLLFFIVLLNPNEWTWTPGLGTSFTAKYRQGLNTIEIFFWSFTVAFLDNTEREFGYYRTIITSLLCNGSSFDSTFTWVPVQIALAAQVLKQYELCHKNTAIKILYLAPKSLKLHQMSALKRENLIHLGWSKKGPFWL